MTTPRVSVPVEPTEAMIEAGNRALSPWIAPAMHAAEAYRAMLSAAPAPEGGAVDGPWTWLTAYVEGDGDPADREYNCDDMVAAWRAGHAALATREEAPAEEGDVEAWLIEHPAQKRQVVDARQFDASSDNFWISREVKSQFTVTPLRAQPPAREDAQPVYALEVVRDPTVEGAKRFVGVTHPAPDALRVAVEALTVARSQAERGADKAGCDGWRSQEMCRQVVQLIDQALAALQAEQGAK